MSLGPVHHALPATALVVVPVAAALPGTVLDGISHARADAPTRLAHPKGIVEVTVDVTDSPSGPTLQSVTVPRTARRLLRGTAYPSPTARGLLSGSNVAPDTADRQPVGATL